MRLKNSTGYLTSILVALTFWLFIATIPPLRVGIWIDSEFVLVVANALFAAIGISLLLLWFSRRQLHFSDQTACFFMITILSAIATIWAKNKVLHHFGVPLLGEGTVLFYGLLLLSLAYDNIQINNFLRFSVIIAGCVAGLLVVLNHPEHGFSINPDWLPYVFGAFLAPIALGVYNAGKDYENKFIKTLIICLSIALLWVSHNKTAWVAVILCIFLWGLIHTIKSRDTVIRLTCISLPILSVVAIYVLGSYPGFGTLESRKLAIQTYIEAWKDNPLSLMYGHGWGYYFENLQKQITQLPVKFFDGELWNPSWDGIERLDFHCMHLGVEVLFSIGFLGLILYVALILSPLNYMKEQPFNKLLFVVIFVSLTSTWFTLVCVWPFLVFCMASLNRPKLALNRSYFLVIAILLGSVCCGHASFTYWNTAMLYQTSKKSWLQKSTFTQPTPQQTVTEYNYYGFHMGHFLLTLTKKVSYLPYDVLNTEFIKLFEMYDPKSSPLALDVAMLHALQYYADKQNPQFYLWEQAAMAVLQKAPKRTDLVVPFVKGLIESNQLDKAQQFITMIKQNNADDPFGIWLEGIYHIQQKEIASGRQLMQFALNKGIDKWIFIPDKLYGQLTKN
mgnify:CR=1 FL=1